MNWQPPDPPEHGNCLNCKASIDQYEVRGDRCIECEDEIVTTSTIKTLIDEQVESMPNYSSSSVPLHEALGLPAYINVSAMPIRIDVTLQGGVRTVELRK